MNVENIPAEMAVMLINRYRIKAIENDDVLIWFTLGDSHSEYIHALILDCERQEWLEHKDRFSG